MKIFLAFATLFSFLILSNNAHTQGTVTVDSITFDKILQRFHTVLLKFDDKFPYGPFQDNFKDLVDSVANAKDFVIAEVPVTDRDNRENYHFGLNYYAFKPDFPVYRLFIKDTPTPIKYVGDRTADDLKRFLLRNTKVWLGLSGTIELLHELSGEFIDATLNNDTDTQTLLLEKAQNRVNTILDTKDQKSGEMYLKIMEAVMKDGIEFFKREERRIHNLLKGKVTKEKKIELRHREHILLSFKPLKESVSKMADAAKDEAASANEQIQETTMDAHKEL
ncbi:unnamed protein product [Adineta steineri]|uniref:Endoplasmic reticulum resident protein 29 n=1 Tax=Adineta steineri TaxID=433720 RepID=A0A819QP52_9BILA|nr:unnamed protein product [Adineta steineri]